MGIELAKAYIRIQADSSGVEGDLNDVRKKVDSSLRGIAAGAAAILGAFGLWGQGIIRQGLGLASEFETITTEMEVMLGSAKEAHETLKSLTQFAVETPFEMPGILQAATGLIQFGERGKGLMDTLKMLGDASGGTAHKFSLLTLVFNQIRGVGHLLTGDFRQLSTRGIISLQDIAKYYKKTTAEAQNMLSSGRISFNDFRKILESMTKEGGRFFDMMKKQSQTLSGLMSTMNDTFNITKRTLATALVPAAKLALNVAILFGNSLESMVRNSNGVVGFALAGATAFGLLGMSILGARFAMMMFNVTMKGFMIGTGIGAALLVIGAGLGAIMGMMSQSAPVMKFFSDMWQRAGNWIQHYINLFTTFMDRHSAQIARIGTLFDETMDNIVFHIEWMVESAAQYFSELFGITDLTFTNMLDIGLGWVTSFMEMLVFLTTDFKLTFQLISVYSQIAFLQMLTYAINWAAYLGAIIVGAAAYLYATMFNAVTGLIGVFVGVGAAIFAAMRNTVMNIGMVFQVGIRAITGMIQGLLKGIQNKFQGKSFALGFAEAFQAEIAKVQGEANLLDPAKAFKDASQSTDKFFGGMKDPKKSFQEAFDSLKGRRGPFDGMLATLGVQASGITQKIKDQMEQNRLFRYAMKPSTKKDLAAKIPLPSKPIPFTLETGRFGFAAFGNKLQDLLLDKKKDHGQEQVDLAKLGLDKQDELIKGVKNIQGGGLTA